MDPAYGSIYQNLYSAQSETGYAGQYRAAVGPEPQLARDTETIRRAIDAAEAEIARSTGQTLRSDARYFLLLNLTQMVLLPFRLHEGPSVHQRSVWRARLLFRRRHFGRPHLRFGRRSEAYPQIRCR